MLQYISAKQIISEEDYYPESDGQPMANTTRHFDWITIIKFGLEQLTRGKNTFIAGDLLWYPVQGNRYICMAPDVMVAIGRPKGDRSSYLQWNEGNIPPQVVFEIRSKSNDKKEMQEKLEFYDRHGVEEYYVYHPKKNSLKVYTHQKGGLLQQVGVNTWISPLLGIKLSIQEDSFNIYHPDGKPFLTFLQMADEKKKVEQRAEQEKQRAEQEKQRAEQERKEKLLLAEKLKELGYNIDDILAEKK